MIALVGVWLAVVGGGAWRWRPAPARLVTPRQPPAAVRRLRVPVAVGVGCVVLLFVWPPLAIGVVGVVSMGPSLARRRAERRRTLAIRRQLPDVVDLLVVAISAGLTPALAIDCLAALAPDPFAGAFDEVRGRRRRGQRLADALDVLPQRLGDPARALAHTLASTERYGTPVGPALELLAHDARRDRRRLAEEAARTVPVKLCFPLVCCTLPAFVLLTIAPLVAGALRSLQI
ncbi:MAG TPA: type II secretion system F family protein [Acidimicrobiales bacterium]|nr:type II secretion system F family protein [Acidimicrobiales bacterium]